MRSTPRDTEYKSVQGLVRGLEILRELNRCPGGGALTAQLSERTGLHRTTVRRLLETLQSEGYVRRSESDDSFRLCIKTRELSEGFRDEQWISEIAVPLLGDLLQKVVWPTDLCTFDVDAMVIRETTHRFSRLSFHRSMVGRRLPMLTTATGRAYIGFCPDDEREQILRLLSTYEDEQSRLALDRGYVDELLLKVRALGFGFNHGHWRDELKIAAIALPVMHGEHVQACLNLVYVAKAMSIDDAARRYLPHLREAVSVIERSLAQPADCVLPATR